MSRSNFSNVVSVKYLARNNELFNQLVDENRSYFKRDGSLNIESVVDENNNLCESIENLPNETWGRSYVSPEFQNSKFNKPPYYFQESNFGRVRKINLIPYYQAVQRAIDVYRKEYKRQVSQSEMISHESVSGGEDQTERFETAMTLASIENESDSSISVEDYCMFNDLVEKVLRECEIVDENTRNKVENRGRYKTKVPYTNLVKQFCLKLRSSGAENQLNEKLSNYVIKVIGKVDCETDYEIAMYLGYDQFFDLKSSNGFCKKVYNDNEKIKEICRKFGFGSRLKTA